MSTNTTTKHTVTTAANYPAQVITFPGPPVFVNGATRYVADGFPAERQMLDICLFAFKCETCPRAVMPTGDHIIKSCPVCSGTLRSMGTGRWTSANVFSMD
jgi:hypothetical protein